MAPKIHILLPVHNRKALTGRFVESLLRQTFANYHLVLIDDGSTDGTAEYVREKVKPLTVITGKGTWWWGGGLHQGYLWLKKTKVDGRDIVLMINNDTEFGPGFLQTAVDLLSAKQRTLLGAQAHGREEGRLIDAGVHVDWQRLTFDQAGDASRINCLSTRGLFLRVSDFLDIGGFHPVILPHYLSDYEFTIRAQRKGYALQTASELKITVDASATGYHGFGDTVGRREFLRKYFSHRSALNPGHWFAFVLLACPWPRKMINLLRVVYGSVAMILKKITGFRLKRCHSEERSDEESQSSRC